MRSGAAAGNYEAAQVQAAPQRQVSPHWQPARRVGFSVGRFVVLAMMTLLQRVDPFDPSAG
jgi:hypothetical protein